MPTASSRPAFASVRAVVPSSMTTTPHQPTEPTEPDDTDADLVTSTQAEEGLQAPDPAGAVDAAEGGSTEDVI